MYTRPVRRMDTACIRILEPDTAFSQVSVSAYTNQLSIRIRIHTLPEYPHTGAVCGYNTHICAVGTPYYTALCTLRPRRRPSIARQIPTESAFPHSCFGSFSCGGGYWHTSMVTNQAPPSDSSSASFASASSDSASVKSSASVGSLRCFFL